MNEYYEAKSAQILTASQLERRGLLHDGVRLADLGIYRIVDEKPECDAELQTLDAGTVQASTDGETVRRVFTASYRDFETVKSVLKSRVKARRKQAEESGTTLDGMAVETDRQSQSMLNGAVEYFRRNPDTTIQWQQPDLTFVALNKDQIDALADVVAAHVQACFARQAAICAELDRREKVNTLLESYNNEIDTGWPGTDPE